jgi:hypothetical protein
MEYRFNEASVMITGTCQKNFAPPYTEIFERFIESLPRRREGAR